MSHSRILLVGILLNEAKGFFSQNLDFFYELLQFFISLAFSLLSNKLHCFGVDGEIGEEKGEHWL